MTLSCIHAAVIIQVHTGLRKSVCSYMHAKLITASPVDWSLWLVRLHYMLPVQLGAVRYS